MARNFFTFADKSVKQFVNGEFEYTNRRYNGDARIEFKRVGRPPKKRIRRKPPERTMTTYQQGLVKCLKGFTWSYFGTGTFDGRKKTPLGLYDNHILKPLLGDFKAPSNRSSTQELCKYWNSRNILESWTSEYEALATKGDYDFTEWKPTETTIHLMMSSIMSILAQRSSKNWKLFYCIEEHKSGKLHTHFLLGSDRAQKGDIAKFSKMWRWMRGGYVRIDPVLSKAKSIDYVVKYITKDLRDWDFLKSESVLKKQTIAQNVKDMEIMKLASYSFLTRL
jgi:hypothetical protein